MRGSNNSNKRAMCLTLSKRKIHQDQLPCSLTVEKQKVRVRDFLALRVIERSNKLPSRVRD